MLLLTDEPSNAIITVSSVSNFVSEVTSSGIVVDVLPAAISATPFSSVKSSAEAEPLEGSAE